MFNLFQILQIVLLFRLSLSQGFTEWLSGVDRTIDLQKAVLDKKNYPVDLFVDIPFRKQFSRVPQVLLMFEEMNWTRSRDVDFYVYAANINARSFRLYYHLGGPALVPKLRVRWVAMVDHTVEIQYVQVGFKELIRLRQGFGLRTDEFDIRYSKIFFPTPRAIPFLTGIKAELGDSDSFNLKMDLKKQQVQGSLLELKTRGGCHIHQLRIAIFIVSSVDVITLSGGAIADAYNQFDNPTRNPIGRRHSRFQKSVPFVYTLYPHQNILAQGIQGFDVHARRGDIVMQVGHEYIKDQIYHMSFGTCKYYKIIYQKQEGDCVLNNLHFGVILRHSSPPSMVFLQEGEDIKDPQYLREIQNQKEDQQNQQDDETRLVGNQ